MCYSEGDLPALSWALKGGSWRIPLIQVVPMCNTVPSSSFYRLPLLHAPRLEKEYKTGWGLRSSLASLLTSGLCAPFFLKSQLLRQKDLLLCYFLMFSFACMTCQLLILHVAVGATSLTVFPCLLGHACCLLCSPWSARSSSPRVRWLKRSCGINREADLWFCFCLCTLTFLTFCEV